MNVKDMLRQASDAAKQLITLSDQTIIGILKETAQVLRTHRYRRRYGECIDITFSIK